MPSVAPPLRQIHYRIMNPLREFLNDSRATGIILIGCTICSLFISNSFNGLWYRNFWNADLQFNTTLHLPSSPTHLINDFLMSFFFLLAGMEIKRELLNGELSSFKKAILPFGAAFGGMLVPALIFVLVNANTPYVHGWGIPTATDIAFSIGVASLLGKRFPVSLKILLLALAIIDDLGAIIVIALFYGGHIEWLYLGISALIYFGMFACNYFKLKFGTVQIILGFCLWFTILQSGIEASITGVLFAFAVPVNTLAVIEKAIHKQVNFIILPLFALANTAILIPSNILFSLNTNIGLGIILGLVIGKPLGIFLISRLMVALRIASLPGNVQWKQFLGMGMLAGIGFTMSIFTTMLAFPDVGSRDIAKISILTAVIGSVVVGYFYFRSIEVKSAKSFVKTPLVTEPSIEQIFEPVLQRLSLYASARG
jgi:NhaA family Na+:H+ antiporter